MYPASLACLADATRNPVRPRRCCKCELTSIRSTSPSPPADLPCTCSVTPSRVSRPEVRSHLPVRLAEPPPPLTPLSLESGTYRGPLPFWVLYMSIRVAQPPPRKSAVAARGGMGALIDWEAGQSTNSRIPVVAIQTAPRLAEWVGRIQRCGASEGRFVFFSTSAEYLAGDQPLGSNPQPLYGQHAFARVLLPAFGCFAQTCGSHAGGTRSRLPVICATTARNCGDANDLNPTNSQDVSEPSFFFYCYFHQEVGPGKTLFQEKTTTAMLRGNICAYIPTCRLSFGIKRLHNKRQLNMTNETTTA